jgi:hypothetical protein
VKGIGELLRKDFQVSLRVPFGYKLVQHNEEFLWVRQLNPTDDRDIFIARRPYTSAEIFDKDSLIAFRDEVCRKYLFEDPEQIDSYLVTETNIPFIPITTDTISFNKQFAVELRGLWKTNTATMGGPFVGYAMVDNKTNQFYYIEAFVYGPSRDLREIVREMEAILFTFQTSEAIAATKK